MRQSQEDLMWMEAAARQERKHREELDAMRQRAEGAEQWQTKVPWPALRMVLDAAYQFAEGNAELWADCEHVQAWVDDHEIGDESCATIHPETWESVTAKLGQTIIRPEFPVDPADYE
jgi:hypothetical protein